MDTTRTDSRFAFPGLAGFLNTGEGGIKASLSEGGDLQYIVPQFEVAAFVAAYPSVDPFREAGANITDLQGPWTDARIPVITSGTEPSSYNEGDGPDSDEPANIYVAQLTAPKNMPFFASPPRKQWKT